ncbi:MAG: hypothetical protein WCQ57_06805 [Verrucomicrobiota bacterium]
MTKEFLKYKAGLLPLLRHSFLILAMFSLLGGHWAILQTVAWTQMLREP